MILTDATNINNHLIKYVLIIGKFWNTKLIFFLIYPYILYNNVVLSLVSCGKHKRKWEIGCIIGHVRCKRWISWSRGLTANSRRGSNWSESVCLDPICVLIGWRSFDRLTRMKVGHVLRQSASFKPNQCNWSYCLQLYFKIIFIYNFCIGKISWAMNCRFVRNIYHSK